MRTLVLGGIRSGKSRWAESAIIENLAEHGTVRYIATGPAPQDDPDWERRVAEHRSRRPSRWLTVETAEVSSHLRADPEVPALVDDLGGWLTAVLDGRGWSDDPIESDVDDLVAAVAAMSADVVLVSPEVGLSVIPTTRAGRRFADELGTLNQRLAGCCERVVLVVAGQPLPVKPTPTTVPR